MADHRIGLGGLEKQKAYLHPVYLSFRFLSRTINLFYFRARGLEWKKALEALISVLKRLTSRVSHLQICHNLLFFLKDKHMGWQIIE